MTSSTYHSGIIASLIDSSYSKKDIIDILNRIHELPIAEIEVELDAVELAVNSSLDEKTKTTAIINYPLGGYEAEYILDSIKWVCQKKIDNICTNLPLFWLVNNEKMKISTLIREIINVSEDKTVRIAFDSELLSEDEISILCDLLSYAEINQVKPSCGFSHKISAKLLSFLKNKYPDLILTVDNNLTGNSPEIDELFSQGVSYVCTREPWLYNF